MPIKVAVPKEIALGEKRVALVPDVVKKLVNMGVEVIIESGAGIETGLLDAAFGDVTIAANAIETVKEADIILKVQPPTIEEMAHYPENAIVLGFLAPYGDIEPINALKTGNITSFSMELVPRISRAQAIDALSSQASAAGYQAAIIAAQLSNKFFPMLTTAAGTIRPAQVLIVGAGVAGLQAIATAKRLGAIVEAYDVRSATKEQVESLGGKFIDTGVSADGAGGYARALTDDEKAQQAEVLAKHIAKSDVIITTAAIPGRPSPRIISKETVERMKPGAVIVDLAAEGGGNCELTRLGEEVNHNGVTIVGPHNIPSQLAAHTSEMYAKNILNFLNLIIEEGEIKLDWDDQVIADSALTHGGKIVHGATKSRIEPDAESENVDQSRVEDEVKDKVLAEETSEKGSEA